MKAYTYNTAGLYVAEIEADESPLEPGVYLLPANSTTKSPPAAKEGKIPRWNGSSWRMVKDRSADTAE